MLEPLRESSAPRTLLVLVRCEVRLGREAREPVQRPCLTIYRWVVEAMLEFLRFKSDRQPSRRIIGLEHRVHPNMGHFLVFKAHCERMLLRVHLSASHLNVHRL